MERQRRELERQLAEAEAEAKAPRLRISHKASSVIMAAEVRSNRSVFIFLFQLKHVAAKGAC